ncbi:MAG: aldehyde ferredoxin oxidoreductase C-terminal domain-containing protein, partial [Desulfovibrionales bacterium]|nr:aldehyde ferredoxin oxidoreductase C-terminal domain-containing protein [Desulfovibrionales bacterium]
VEGIKKREPSSPALKTLVRDYVNKIKSGQPVFNDFSTTGSSGHVQWLNDSGQLGTKNYREGHFPGVEKIDGKHLLSYVEKKTSCHKCPVRCKADIKIKQGRHKGFSGGRPEYEIVINMGSLCGLGDPDELLYLSNLSNILGMDAITTGSVIAFAMDLFDRGILTLEDTNGLDLSWGNAQSMETLMHWMAQRKGIGATLCLGVKRAAEIIGKGAERFAFHTKGVEIYGADPRGSQAVALSYTVSLRGGDFTSVYPIPAFRYSPEKAQEEFGTPEAVNLLSTGGKGILVKKCLFASAVVDSLGLCKVPTLSIITGFNLENEAPLVQELTGLTLSAKELMAIGERLVNMEKLFNLTHGTCRADDNLPEVFQKKGLPSGPAKGITVTDLSVMVDDFYRAMGWDSQGQPTPDTLERLRLTA